MSFTQFASVLREEAFNSSLDDVAKPTVTFTKPPQHTDYWLLLLLQVLKKVFSDITVHIKTKKQTKRHEHTQEFYEKRGEKSAKILANVCSI